MSVRIKNAKINMIIIGMAQCLSFIYSLISKRLFLANSSISVLGVFDLFDSFFSSLSLLELGFGTILIFNLLKPMAEKNKEEIKKQLSVFKTIFSMIALIIIVISIIAAPFIFNIFNITLDNIGLVYLIYFANIIFIVNKFYLLNIVSVISASQHQSIYVLMNSICELVGFIIRVVGLLVFNSVELYILSLFFAPIFSYILSAKWVNIKYGYTNIKFASINEVLKSNVLGQCKQYLIATIYSLSFSMMDSMIISSVIDTDSLAYVTNYNSIMTTGFYLITTIVSSFRGILSDIYYKENKQNFYVSFKIINKVSFILTSIMFIGMYFLLTDFIKLWIGSEYVISNSLVITLLLTKAIGPYFENISSVFTIKGYMLKMKIPLIISMMTNIIFSIIFIYKIGLIGVYIATIISILIVEVGKFSYLFSNIFKNERKEIIKNYFIEFVMLILEYIIIKYTFGNIEVNSLILLVYKSILVCCLISVISGISCLLDNDIKNYLKGKTKRI